MLDGDKARGRYIGPLPMMKGVMADLVVYPTTGRAMAQFDEGTAGYVAPTDFQLAHFEIVEPFDPNAEDGCPND